MLNIRGYQVLEQLYQGPHSTIYRAIKQDDQQQCVIIKVPSVTPPQSAQIDKLRKEFEICRRIDSDYVVQCLELKPDDVYGFLLIEKDDQADALINHIPKTGFEIIDFLKIAIQLAEGLGAIHRNRVIHKDIKPTNIIYHPGSGKIKYIDFNNASLLHQYRQNTSVLDRATEGTLAYISPECTGRINRMIDYRTDFYSLGITFYQLLCGKLPFEVKSVAELLLCHLDRQPLAPTDVKSEIPKPLSDIIMKLLQKDIEARYQSAFGLLTDLKKCIEEFTQTGKITPFILAEQDIPEFFYIPQKLYGRESECLQLTQAFDRVT